MMTDDKGPAEKILAEPHNKRGCGCFSLFPQPAVEYRQWPSL